MARQLVKVAVLDPHKVGAGKVCAMPSGARYKVTGSGQVLRVDCPEHRTKAGRKQLKRLRRDLLRAAALERALSKDLGQ